MFTQQQRTKPDINQARSPGFGNNFLKFNLAKLVHLISLDKNNDETPKKEIHHTCDYFSRVLFVVSSFTQNYTADNITQPIWRKIKFIGYFCKFIFI